MSATEIRVCIDVGSSKHQVAIGLSDGSILEEFELSHNSMGFKSLFHRIEVNSERYHLPVSVAMESYNGYARPLDDYTHRNQVLGVKLSDLRPKPLTQIP